MVVDLIFEFLNKKDKYGVRNRSVVLFISMMVTMISVILFKLSDSVPLAIGAPMMCVISTLVTISMVTVIITSKDL